MSKISEKLGYIHGLMDGLKLAEDDDKVKLLGMIVDVLDDVSSSIVQLEDDQQELNDYVENIDDDLADLEMQHRDEDEDFDDFDDDDFEIVTDEAPKKRAHGKLSVLKPHDDANADEDDIPDEDVDDEPDDEMFIGCICPECGKFFTVHNPDDYAAAQKFECPFCKAHVGIEPMGRESVPVAKPVDED